MSQMFRARVVRADGRAINVVQRRAHLSYCFTGCCCGRTERGYAAVPVDTFKDEWLRRKLRNVVHLTKAGCLGPCALANVASLVFDGRAVWFHSVNTPWHVRLIYDYIETMVRADRFVAPPSELAEYVFNFYDWDVRPPTAPAHAVSHAARRREPRRDRRCCRTPTPICWRCTRARATLPADLDVVGVSLVAAADRRADVAAARGRAGGCARRRAAPARRARRRAGLRAAARMAASWRVISVVVSGTGEPRADFARVEHGAASTSSRR